MRQFAIAGEVQWPSAQAATGPFAFQVSRPGLVIDVKANLQSGRATLQRTDLNAWGVMQVLHTFTGVRAADSRSGRDWALTTLWAFSMDAVAVGLIFHGVRQLRYVVPSESEAAMGDVRIAPRVRELRSVRGRPSVAQLREPTTDKTCGTDFVLPSLNLKRALPLNQPVVIEFTPAKSGDIAFACGMNLLHGTVVVR